MLCIALDRQQGVTTRAPATDHRCKKNVPGKIKKTLKNVKKRGKNKKRLKTLNKKRWPQCVQLLA